MLTPLISQDDLTNAGAEAGAYLESLGKTDLRALSPEEFMQLVVIIVNTANAGACERWTSGMMIPVGGLG